MSIYRTAPLYPHRPDLQFESSTTLAVNNYRLRIFDIGNQIVTRINETISHFSMMQTLKHPCHGDYIINLSVLDCFDRSTALSIVDKELIRDNISCLLLSRIPTEYSFTLASLIYLDQPATIDKDHLQLAGYSRRPVQVDNYPDTDRLIMFYLPCKVWFKLITDA